MVRVKERGRESRYLAKSKQYAKPYRDIRGFATFSGDSTEKLQKLGEPRVQLDHSLMVRDTQGRMDRVRRACDAVSE